MNVYPAKVNRTITYRTAAGKPRPAVITGGLATPLNVTASSRTGGVVTLSVTNSLAAGGNMSVELQDGSYSGVYPIATANGTTITYSQPGQPDDPDGGTGTITDIDIANLRVGHHGETYTGKRRRTDPDVENDTWIPGGN